MCAVLGRKKDSHHGSCLVEINLVRLQLGLLFRLIWVLGAFVSIPRSLKDKPATQDTHPAVNLELLHQDGFLLGHGLASGERRGEGTASQGEAVYAGCREQGLHVVVVGDGEEESGKGGWQ
jgi:hypothetical protein